MKLGAHHQQMLDEIAADFVATRHYTGEAEFDGAVRGAMQRVVRERFVPEEVRGSAYFNRPLQIGHGQTISQPFIVALMTQIIRPQPHHRVLEIGTGSGYQAAVLASLVDHVYSVEVIAELSAQARIALRAEGFDNVSLQVGDGHAGWPEHAPYDGILVTAAGPGIPQPLVDQLTPGGRLALPVGRQFGAQMLRMVRKDENGEAQVSDILPVSFVPLTAGQQ